MKILIIAMIILFFFVYPTWAVFQRRITVRGVTVYHAKTPLTFWSLIVFFYYCGVAFPYIMWQLPYSIVFLFFMSIIFAVHAMMYVLKW